MQASAEDDLPFNAHPEPPESKPMARTRTITEVEDLSDAEPDYDEHPLFPLVENEKPYEVSYIMVQRLEQGVLKTGPTHTADELRTESDLFSLYGGGNYVLTARAKSVNKNLGGVELPGRQKKARKLNLPGVMKPMGGRPTQEERALYTDAPPQAAPAQGMGDMSNLFMLMMKMGQDANERATAASQNFMNMFMTMMGNSKAEQTAMTQMMMNMSAQSQQSMMGLVTAVLANRGGGPDELVKTLDLFKSMGVAGLKKDDEGGAKDLLESLPQMLSDGADLVQGLSMLKGNPGVGAGPNANGAAHAGPAPAPGSAESLVRSMMK